jgi:DNA-binding transcriptional ArsR family regulator
MDHLLPDSLLDHVAERFRLLGDPTRLAILRCLMAGERSVGAVVEDTGLGQANVSKHLKLLADAGLVARRKAGLQALYTIADPLVEQLCRLVCGSVLARMHEDVQRKRALIDSIAPSTQKAPAAGNRRSAGASR